MQFLSDAKAKVRELKDGGSILTRCRSYPFLIELSFFKVCSNNLFL